MSVFSLLTSGTKNPRQWLLDAIGGGRATSAGKDVSPDGAMALAAYYACLRNISEDLAKLPLKVYRRLRPRGRESVPDHPAYRLLHDRANEESSAMSVRETLVHHALAWGGGYAEITRNGRGEPVGLWPIHPSRVYLWRTVRGTLRYQITVDGQRSDLPPEDVFHLHGLGGDGLAGYRLSVLAKEAVGLGLAAEEFGASYFGNGTVMGGILEHPGKLSDPARKRLAESLARDHKGSGNAHKVRILEEGMKFESLGVPPNEAQFLETRQFQVEEVCRWFRMPPHKVQHLLRTTFSNIEQQSIEYVVDTLTPWAVRFEQEAKVKLLGEAPDLYAEHVFAGLLRGDAAQRGNYYRALYHVGALSAADIRELENLDPAGVSDKYFVPVNMQTAEKAEQAEAREPAEQPPPPNRAQAFAPLVVEAVERVRSKEALALSRQRKKDGFAEWLPGFATEQAEWLRGLLAHVYRASAEMGGMNGQARESADGAARAVADAYRTALAGGRETDATTADALERIP